MSSPEPIEPAALDTADAVARAVDALYGDPVLETAGVLHVASAADVADGRHVLRITGASPKSAVDTFALHLARARADVVLTTGAILRDEPALRYDLGDGPSARGLEAYRRERLGKASLPDLWVLTSGRGLDPDHPALNGPFPTTVVAPAGASLPARFRRRDIPDGGVRALVERAREEAPERLLAVEAGPRTHRALYDAPGLVDELMLTLYLGDLAPELLGGFTVGDAAIDEAFGPPRSQIELDQAGGRFRFLRYRR